MKTFCKDNQTFQHTQNSLEFILTKGLSQAYLTKRGYIVNYDVASLRVE